ncbi:transcriptional regulator, LysR family [Shimia marina]|uniref:HTH-type transcriptional activator CmpR n=1 Tax=Shimia marina TaxID=321267 RepID=A0A0P1FBZ5_9RHOB|nr:HTH-type transcriptional activator CmpR [Shimia marina]SFD97737.1 transcriptional regulator, LysR family [Shimia marina]
MDKTEGNTALKFQIRQLEAFRAVAETGSITKAAAVLGISQPAVSRLMSDFSKSVGFELFQRRRGVLEPTSDSRYLLAEVSRILDRLDHLDDLRRDIAERKSGHIRIACLPGFATSHLPGVLVDFLADRPGVTVTLEPDRPERILEWIIGEQYDCAITDGFSGHPATEATDVKIRSVLIMPEGHPLAERALLRPSDIQQEKLIHSRRDSPFFRQLERAFAEDGAQINSWIEVRQFTAACTIVAQGHGVSVVSALDAEQYRDQGLIIRPFAPQLDHRLSILRPITGNASPLVFDFIKAFTDSLAPYTVPMSRRTRSGATASSAH